MLGVRKPVNEETKSRRASKYRSKEKMARMIASKKTKKCASKLNNIQKKRIRKKQKQDSISVRKQHCQQADCEEDCNKSRMQVR